MPPAEAARTPGTVAGVILAAGSSSRMGSNKMLLPLEGEALIRRAVRQALAAGLDPVLVVLGHEADRARLTLEGLPCTTVLNADHAQGVRTSLRAGVGALPGETPAAVVILGDMPFVTADMLRALLARYRDQKPPLVVSRYGEVTAPPILYDRSLFEELVAGEGEGCGKHVVKSHRQEAVMVDWPEAALADVDVPADYERLKAQAGG
jgi:molybdenum cofactor cytidylyltransferase